MLILARPLSMPLRKPRPAVGSELSPEGEMFEEVVPINWGPLPLPRVEADSVLLSAGSIPLARPLDRPLARPKPSEDSIFEKLVFGAGLLFGVR